MITLLQKDYRTDIVLDEILPISSRADLYKAVKLMGIGGCSQLEKARLCEGGRACFGDCWQCEADT